MLKTIDLMLFYFEYIIMQTKFTWKKTTGKQTNVSETELFADTLILYPISFHRNHWGITK